MGEPDQHDLREALKTVAVALKHTGRPFALIGGYGVWARGGPEPNHDADFLIAKEDAAAVAQSLADQGLQVVQPPEDWLFKVFVDDALVDIIFRPAGSFADHSVVERATPLRVLSIEMPVMPATDLLVHRLNALTEHYCDFAVHIPVARALREQVDWDVVRRDTASNDFATALLFLLERLDIVEPSAGSGVVGRVTRLGPSPASA
ncbi:nucleotidyltransferase family protein [Intrasporangium calvum]|uniref:Nucleotidyltransferase family protein n=1 Tax=Intrasporangium calvum TaxID=53358 RepID=A0ABT5GH10_9MICO|nr:hypothetical protein [Intrasporangium calvum]MDC5697504.1 nucleotidyltransferase family protein [Intrasporangium calvum]